MLISCNCLENIYFYCSFVKIWLDCYISVSMMYWDVIVRRYSTGISNLFNLFMNEVDGWMIYDDNDREKIAWSSIRDERVVILLQWFELFTIPSLLIYL